LEGVTGNIESKVRSAADVRMRFFGATFFLEAEVLVDVISVIEDLCQYVRHGTSQNTTHEWYGLVMDLVPCPESHRVGPRPSVVSESG
jgi:hypothetical protein